MSQMHVTSFPVWIKPQPFHFLPTAIFEAWYMAVPSCRSHSKQWVWPKFPRKLRCSQPGCSTPNRWISDEVNNRGEASTWVAVFVWFLWESKVFWRQPLLASPGTMPQKDGYLFKRGSEKRCVFVRVCGWRVAVCNSLPLWNHWDISLTNTWWLTIFADITQQEWV